MAKNAVVFFVDFVGRYPADHLCRRVTGRSAADTHTHTPTSACDRVLAQMKSRAEAPPPPGRLEVKPALWEGELILNLRLNST